MKSVSLKIKLIFFSACFFAGMTGFSVTTCAEESQVAVSAAGTVSVKPDMAEFGVVVKSDAKTADKAAAETAEKYRKVQSALRTAGIPLEDAPSASYTVSPLWEWDQVIGKSLLKGYSARHTIMVKVRNLAIIGRAIDAAVQAGANEVQNIMFSSSSYEGLRQQALAAAVSNARRDAAIMARAAGGRLGQLIEVSVSQPVYGVRPVMEAMAMKAAPAPAPTEIAPSEQDIVVTINSRWRFIASPAIK
jgi:uncharacterized protein YggE